MYLEKRRRRYYACHDIPSELQKTLGRKRFIQSLETEQLTVAKRRAAPLEARWRADIEQARRPSADPVERDAAYWQKVLKETPEAERPMVLAMIGDEAAERADRAGIKAGVIDHRDEAYEALPEVQNAERFVAIATGKIVRLEEHLEEYLATLQNEAKTVDMKRSTIKRFCEDFPFVSDVTRKDVQKWLNRLAQDGKKAATLRRALSELRGYWSYLQSIEAAADDSRAFEKLTIPKGPKVGKSDEREAFTPEDVVRLWKAAKSDGDTHLADLIELDMWTGARIEELCGLPKDNASTERLAIADAKTQAGVREVPVHPKLKRTVARLIRESKDGFLIAGLSANKYGDRHDAIGKRFARLKRNLGLGPKVVFHSIRKTVITLLENALVPENVTADIVGHKKKTMTYGVYSTGATLMTKKAAIEKLRYPAT